MKYTPDQIWEKLQKGVFIIAEAGKNFIQTEADQTPEVYLKNAMQLVDEAAKAGADAIKFQTHTVEDEILNVPIDSPHFPNWKRGGRYGWVSRNTNGTPVKEFWLPLKAYAETRGILFFSTPMSYGAAKRIHEEIGQPLWKIGSGDILDFKTLDYMRNTTLPIILSSGMSTLEEVKQSFNFLTAKNKRVALLHCVSKYPTPTEDLNLKTMELFREEFPGTPVGLSDHSVGTDVDGVAIAMGATILEKHFSLGRDIWGPDHKVSMTPAELTEMVQDAKVFQKLSKEEQQKILQTEFARIAMGRKEKFLQEGEKVFRPLFRKALRAGQDIPAGTVLTEEMIYAMRPQTVGGLPSENYEKVLGKKIKIALKKFDPIEWQVFA